jgi:SAM-dependent methyltransferase
LDQSLLELHARLEQEHWWFTGRRVILDRVLDHYLSHPARLLDVGCGTGGNLMMLSQHGEAMGLDGSTYAVMRARELTGQPVLLGTLPGPLPADLGQFNAVCLFDVLEHIELDHEALIMARELLAPDGLIFITVPALPWLWSQHDVEFGHYRRYDRASLSRTLGLANLSLVHCSYFCSLLFPLIAFFRLLAPVLSGKQRQHDFEVPTAGLNALLHRLFAAEARWITVHTLPLGSSLLVVARRSSKDDQ